MPRFRALLSSLLLAAAPAAAHDEGQVLDIEIAPDANPWTHLDFLDDPDDFQFAIMSDRSGGTRLGVFARAIDKVNQLRPAFVMCVGDLIDIHTDSPAELDAKWDQFDHMVNRLHMPFFYVAGNHDIYDERSLAKWRERLGRSYYHFVYRDVLFLVLDTEDSPPNGVSAAQVAYVEEALRQNADARWTLVFMHRPLWAREQNGMVAVEAALAGRPHTVFAGHWHSYEKYVRAGNNYYRLATTGGGSRLAGVEQGSFDHIAWVTMTGDGPVVANLLLQGIEDDDPRTPPPPLREVLTFPQPAEDGSDRAVAVRAPRATITPDGDPSDWAGLAADAVEFSSTRDTLQCQIQYAWDADRLYVLVRESPGDTTRTEAPDQAAYQSPPWRWEGVSFFIDVDNYPFYDGFVADFNPWFGFSSQGRDDLYCARTDRTRAANCTPEITPGLRVATAGTHADGDRVIEAAIPWRDIEKSVPRESLGPAGFPAIAAGLRIGCEPLLLDDGHRGQHFISGHRTARPNGRDQNSRDILLTE